MNFSKLIKLIFNQFGLELNKLTVNSNSNFQLLKFLNFFNIDFIFDIGANEGQFASELYSLGYSGSIVSFEPLSLAHSKLIKNSILNNKWTIHDRCAIGDACGNIDINISKNSVSSSILPMLDAHTNASHDSNIVDRETTPIFTLDFLFPEYSHRSTNFFIKIDTQGYESKVLDGAVSTLSFCKGILCELSLNQLYDGQELWLQMISKIESFGFVLWSLQPGFTDPISGRTLQVDAIFIRNEFA